MRWLASSSVVLVLLACGKPADKPAESESAAAPEAAAPAGLSLADVAGTWKVHGVAEGDPSTTVDYDMVIGAEGSGWTINFPNREPIPARVVSVDGDSVVVEAGPFESVLRKGVQVSTTSTNRLVGGKLVGTTVARYANAGADSVLRISTEATRAE
jgi:hypothetical protein